MPRDFRPKDRRAKPHDQQPRRHSAGPTPSTRRPNGPSATSASRTKPPPHAGALGGRRGPIAVNASARSAGRDQEEDDDDDDDDGADDDDDDEDDVDDETLLREIRAMGGDDQDLQLVSSSKARASASRETPAKKGDASLGDDVRSFIKSLKLDTKEPPPAASAMAKSKATTKTTATAEPASERSGRDGKGKAKDKENGAKDKHKAEPEPKTAKRDGGQSVKEAKKEAASTARESQAETLQPNGNRTEVKAAVAAARNTTSTVSAIKASEAAAAAASSSAASGKNKLLFEPVPRWSTVQLPELPEVEQDEEEEQQSRSDVKKGKKQKGQRRRASAAASPLATAVSEDEIEALHQRGKALLEADNAAFSTLARSGSSLGVGTLSASDAKFIASLLSNGGTGTGTGSSSSGGGTLSDRIAASTLLLQSSPMHNLHQLDVLLAMCARKGREESGRATRALCDWLCSPGGLAQRKLRYFRDQPSLAHLAALARLERRRGASDAVHHRRALEMHLMHHAFEDRLKRSYFSLLQTLEVQSHDTVAFVRKQAVTQVYLLLRDKSEQEQNLLRLLVNKLGDGERGVASRASAHLLELLNVHPNMKAVVAREVGNLILKPGTAAAAASAAGSSTTTGGSGGKQNEHARYYGVVTLNQTLLTPRDTAVANLLVDVYFDLFEGVLGEDGVVGGGEGEELREGQGEEGAGEKRGKSKLRWRDGNKGKVGKGKGKGKGKAKALARKAQQQPKVVHEAHAKMMAAILTGVRRAVPYAELDGPILDKHMATLFRVTYSGNFNISIQALQLIFQVITAARTRTSAPLSSSSSGSRRAASQDVTDRFYRTLYSSLVDERVRRSSKQAMYLNLVYRALRASCEWEEEEGQPQRPQGGGQDGRTKALVKRLCQTLLLAEPHFICGALYLLGELFRAKPSLRSMLTDPEDDGVERFFDAPEERGDARRDGARGGGDGGGDEEEDEAEASRRREALRGERAMQLEAAKRAAEAVAAATTTTTTTTKLNAAAPTKTRHHAQTVTAYDAKKRDPKWAGAELTCLWELVPLLHHYHPSVCLHARQLLDSERITTSADLSLHTLSHFLDRFVYRNPKKLTLATQQAAAAAAGASTIATAAGTIPQRGPSAMQPAANAAAATTNGGGETSVVRVRGAGVGVDEVVNSERFWRKRPEEVPVDQLFFHRYFNERRRRETRGARRAAGDAEGAASDVEEGEGEEGDDDDDDEIEIEGESSSEEDDQEEEGQGREDDAEAKERQGAESEDSEAEAEIWKAMKASMPREAGDDAGLLDDSDDEEEDDDEEDLEMYDYSDSDEEEEDEEGGGVEGREEQDDGEDDEVRMLQEDEDDLLPFDGFAEEGEEEEDDDDGGGGGGVVGSKNGKPKPGSKAARASDETKRTKKQKKRARNEDEEEEEEEEEDEEGLSGVGAVADDGGRKASAKEARERRRKNKAARRALPTFASADDYAHLLGGDGDEDEGAEE